MNELFAIAAGIGLAAACGFRVFAPFFVASLAANSGVDAFGGVEFASLLGDQYAWIGSDAVTITLGVATALEIGAYYIPWLDNLLDSIASPAAVIAGAFATVMVMPEFAGDGSMQWIIAAILGGGAAGTVQGATVVTRGASSATTGGVGNPVVSTGELGGAVMTAGLAVFVPILAGILVLMLLFFAVRRLVRFFLKRRRNMQLVAG